MRKRQRISSTNNWSFPYGWSSFNRWRNNIEYRSVECFGEFFQIKFWQDKKKAKWLNNTSQSANTIVFHISKLIIHIRDFYLFYINWQLIFLSVRTILSLIDVRMFFYCSLLITFMARAWIFRKRFVFAVDYLKNIMNHQLLTQCEAFCVFRWVYCLLSFVELLVLA